MHGAPSLPSSSHKPSCGPPVAMLIGLLQKACFPPAPCEDAHLLMLDPCSILCLCLEPVQLPRYTSILESRCRLITKPCNPKPRNTAYLTHAPFLSIVLCTVTCVETDRHAQHQTHILGRSNYLETFFSSHVITSPTPSCPHSPSPKSSCVAKFNHRASGHCQTPSHCTLANDTSGAPSMCDSC